MAAAGPFLDINRRSQESSEDRVGMALNKGGERQAPAWLQPSSRGSGGDGEGRAERCRRLSDCPVPIGIGFPFPRCTGKGHRDL